MWDLSPTLRRACVQTKVSDVLPVSCLFVSVSTMSLTLDIEHWTLNGMYRWLRSLWITLEQKLGLLM